MADCDVTRSQVRNGFTTLTPVDVSTADFEWLEDHIASFSSPVTALYYADTPLRRQHHRNCGATGGAPI
jgi:hypothetical protein